MPRPDADPATVASFYEFCDTVFAETAEALKPYTERYVQAGLAQTAFQGASLTFEARPEESSEESRWADFTYEMHSKGSFYLTAVNVLRPGEPEHEPLPAPSVVLDSPDDGVIGILLLPRILAMHQAQRPFTAYMQPPTYYGNNDERTKIKYYASEIAEEIEKQRTARSVVKSLGQPTTRFTGLNLPIRP